MQKSVRLKAGQAGVKVRVKPKRVELIVVLPEKGWSSSLCCPRMSGGVFWYSSNVSHTVAGIGDTRQLTGPPAKA